MAREILIAAPDKADQGEFKKIFEATDYNLVFSESGEHALLRLKLFKPDLIITGPPAKEKGSFDVCKAVKSDPAFKDIPVVLLSNVYEEISEDDGKRVRADGIITRPLHEEEILNLVDRLIEAKEKGTKKGAILEKEGERKATAEMGKAAPRKEEEFLLGEIGGTEEEVVIELMDVVEEPELKMSIDDFVVPKKEASLPEVAPLESWERLMEEEKPVERRFNLDAHKEEFEAKGLRFQLGEEKTLNGEPSEKELLEKIELEEILKKVEQLAPSIEKEWPKELKKEALEAGRPSVEEHPEKYEGLAEFEAALKMGIGAEPTGKEVPPVYVEKPKEKPKEAVPEKIVPTEAPAEMALEEESKEEEELKVLGEKELKALEEEALKGLEAEKMAEFLFEEIEKEKAGGAEKVEEERIDLFEEREVAEVEKDGIRIIEEPEEETLGMLEELEIEEVPVEEVRVVGRPKKERVEIFEEVTAPAVRREKIVIPSRAVERQVEEVILKGTKEMLEGFITKLVPEMTQSIMNLTIERIEQMVRKIVPEIAEKMIQEEIKRLQKEEKE